MQILRAAHLGMCFGVRDAIELAVRHSDTAPLTVTRQLVETCTRHCARVHHVQTDADLCVDWFRGAETVGLTAGTSTPDEVVDRVESRIRTFAPGDHAGVTGRIGVAR